MDVAADDIELIRSADTFFLSTTHPERGNDASHRRGSGRLRVRRPHDGGVAGLPGQQHVQQFRQSCGGPDRRAAIHRLPQRAHAAAVGQRARHVGAPAADGAMANLGDLLAQLHPPELATARAWLERAAESGRLDAMTSLATLLLRLQPPDLPAARAWLERAAAAGDATARSVLIRFFRRPDAPESFD